MKATYTSVWEGGIEVTTSCNYNPHNGLVSDVETADVGGLDILHDEYVELEDGTKLKVLDFEKLQELWIEQETDCDENEDQLVNEIAETDGYDELLDVIRLWSQKPVTERMAEFLKRNQACFIYE